MLVPYISLLKCDRIFFQLKEKNFCYLKEEGYMSLQIIKKKMVKIKSSCLFYSFPFALDKCYFLFVESKTLFD